MNIDRAIKKALDFQNITDLVYHISKFKDWYRVVFYNGLRLLLFRRNHLTTLTPILYYFHRDIRQSFLYSATFVKSTHSIVFKSFYHTAVFSIFY